ncbi:MAG: thioredoxin domain-containing protein, partial [Planctomycetaceae bacterium]
MIHNCLTVRMRFLLSAVPAVLCAISSGLFPLQAQEPLQEAGRTNRLAQESSPYLLMHAHNPLDWYPWGPEAFEKAQDEDKPVFLSVGYSSCYWCHVMEREVFSNAKIAEFMNRHFVCIKVDREERPDVDDLYMTSLIVYQQAAGRAGAGGWPLSMFLDFNGNPIAGATYLPPEDTPDGRTGFLTAAQRILDLWRTNREGVEQTSALLAREVRRLSGPAVIAQPAEIDEELLQGLAAGILQRYDATWGGVDLNPNRPDGPRFPNVPRLSFLLSMYERFGDEQFLRVVQKSLDQMAMGGIRDHLGGGFHRYSTERTWTVPHFEKMLYDQAQMLEIYSRAALLTGDPLYQQVVAEIVVYLRREMLLDCGGFCSALDAETNAIEGEYYVWTQEEIAEILPQNQLQPFLTAYGFDQPQDFEHGRILYLPQRIPAADPQKADSELLTQLAGSRQLLLQRREQRERPFRDDKILTEWN